MSNIDQHSNRPQVPMLKDGELTRESWKIFQIMAEFVEGFEKLAAIPPSVSIFGSARTKPDHPDYALATEIAERLSNSGFSVVSGVLVYVQGQLDHRHGSPSDGTGQFKPE